MDQAGNVRETLIFFEKAWYWASYWGASEMRRENLFMFRLSGGRMKDVKSSIAKCCGFEKLSFSANMSRGVEFEME